MSEHTKEIRFHIGEIMNLLRNIELAEVVAQPPTQTPPVDPQPTPDPTPTPPANDDQWHPTSGFSRVADNVGFGLVRLITEHEAKFNWPENLKAKTARRFVAEPFYRTAEAAEEVRLKMAQNLSRRMNTINMTPPMYVPDAILVGVKRKPQQARNFNMSPEQQASQLYTFTDDAILVCENSDTTGTGTGAWSTDWNPEKDASWLYEKHLAHAHGVALSLGLIPSEFGL